jgi:hypothetical protein
MTADEVDVTVSERTSDRVEVGSGSSDSRQADDPVRSPAPFEQRAHENRDRSVRN